MIQVSSSSHKIRLIVSFSVAAILGTAQIHAQGFSAGKPLGANNEAGDWVEMSDNVKVFGSFHFAESCTFDPARNLILAMNSGDRTDASKNDGYVSLINPDGSVPRPNGSELREMGSNSTIHSVVLSRMASYTRSTPIRFAYSTLSRESPCVRYMYPDLPY